MPTLTSNSDIRTGMIANINTCRRFHTHIMDEHIHTGLGVGRGPCITIGCTTSRTFEDIHYSSLVSSISVHGTFPFSCCLLQ